MEKQLVNLADGVSQATSSNSKDATYNRINLALLSSKLTLIENIKHVINAYRNTNPFKDFQEFKDIIAKINSNFTDLKVPDLDEEALYKIITTTRRKTSEKVEFFVEIPLVHSEPWIEYFIAPSPCENSKKIADTEPIKAVFNKAHELYFLENDFLKVNDTIKITKENILLFSRVSESEKCAIRAIQNTTQPCSLKTLPENYDNWIQTPIHNTFLYHSNAPKTLTCDGIRNKIKSETGVIELKRGCVINSGKYNIIASADRTSIKRHFFKLETKIDNNKIKLRESKKLNLKIETSGTINDESLDKAIKDLEEAAINEKYEVNKDYIIAIIILAAVLLLIGVIAYFKYCANPKKTQQASSNDSLPLTITKPRYITEYPTFSSSIFATSTPERSPRLKFQTPELPTQNIAMTTFSDKVTLN